MSFLSREELQRDIDYQKLLTRIVEVLEEIRDLLKEDD